MIKMTRPVVLLIVLTLMVTFNFPVTADELSDALKQQEKILNQQKNAEGNLNSLTTKAQQMEKQIRQLTTQISDAEVDLDHKENAHAKAQEEVTAIQTEVTAKQQELKGRQDTLRSRVRAIYEEGQVNYLEVLFQSTDLSDFISRVEYLSCLVENDQTILSDIRVQKQDLDEKKELLVAKMDEAESLKQQAEAAKSYLDSSKSKKK